MIIVSKSAFAAVCSAVNAGVVVVVPVEVFVAVPVFVVVVPVAVEVAVPVDVVVVVLALATPVKIVVDKSAAAILVEYNFDTFIKFAPFSNNIDIFYIIIKLIQNIHIIYKYYTIFTILIIFNEIKKHAI
ncbi:hypothetical protein ETI08_12650 [Macrococcoides goetzii]|nr:hypothetical protein ETI08_12650 [Macrococcus goetzii]